MELAHIKEIRRTLGLTQHELAQRSNVSQSLIAKIEAGRLDPAYTNAQKILHALDAYGKTKELNAEAIMASKMASTAPSASVKDAIQKMRNHGFSQLPVILDHKSIGLVTETGILNALLQGKNKTVQDVMESPPPIVSADTKASALSEMLKHFPLLLVSNQGKLVGVITKTDLLAKLYSR